MSKLFNSADWVSFRAYMLSADFFQNILSGLPSEYQSLDSDQAGHFVGPNLGPNCLQKLASDDICG